MSGRGLFLIYPLSSALCSPADLPQTGRPAYPGKDVPFPAAVCRGIPPQSSLAPGGSPCAFSPVREGIFPPRCIAKAVF